MDLVGFKKSQNHGYDNVTGRRTPIFFAFGGQLIHLYYRVFTSLKWKRITFLFLVKYFMNSQLYIAHILQDPRIF